MIKKILKRCFILFTGILMLAIGLCGVACNSASSSSNSEEKPTYVLNQPLLELNVGETFALCVLSSEDKTVAAQFSSTMPEIASVAANGEVTANKIGETKITASVNGQTLTCIVRISVKMQAVPELVLQGMRKTGDNYSLTLMKGTQYTVNPTLRADGESLSVEITATSDTPQSVKIENNVITAQGVAENVKLTFRCTYEAETYETICYVRVEEVSQ